ncbi:hypothetical protein ACFT0G_32195, partial [Streptomyces sp. NPDC057020]
FVPVQLLAAAGALTGRRAAELHVRPRDAVEAEERDALCAAAARLLGDPSPTGLTDPAATGHGESWADIAGALTSAVRQALDKTTTAGAARSDHA